MGVILLPPWHRQPPVPTRPNARHWARSSLLHLWHGAVPSHDVLRGRPSTISGAPAMRAGPAGLSPNFAGSQDYRWSGSALGADPDEATLFALARADSTSSERCILSLSDLTDNNALFRLVMFSGGDGYGAQIRGSLAEIAKLNSGVTATTVDAFIALSYRKSGEKSAWVDGKKVASTTDSLGALNLNQTEIGSLVRTGAGQFWEGAIYLAGVLNRALSDAEQAQLAANPWALFAPRRIFVPMYVPAGVTHTTTGALAAGAASVAGTAAHVALHTTTGALAAQAAAVAGAAAHLLLHTSTGALSAAASAVAGTAAHQHAATGALAALAASVAGTAAHLTLHETTGALSAQAATVAGDAEYSADGAFDAAGSLSAQAAAVVGAAQRFALHTTEGALSAGAATVAGTAARLALHTSDGAIAAGPATIAGSAAHIALHDAAGDLEAGAATIVGTSIHTTAGASDPAAVWNYQLSNGLTAGENLVQNNEMLRIIMAGIAGLSSGTGTDTETYFGADGVTPRITATFDAAGNRITVITDGAP